MSRSDLARSAAGSRGRTVPATRSGATPRIGGFDNCQPSAPGWDRTAAHPEAHALVVAPPAGEARAIRARMAFVHEAAGDRAGPGVHVPCSGTRPRNPRRCRASAAVVVADRVREVEAHGRAGRHGRAAISARSKARRCGTARPATRSSPGAGRVRRWRVRSRPSRTCRPRRRARLPPAPRPGRSRGSAPATPARSDRTETRRLPSAGPGARGSAIEADQHQVQVRGQRIYRHHFGGLRRPRAPVRRAPARGRASTPLRR